MSKTDKIRDGINAIISEDARDTLLQLLSSADELQQTMLFAAGRYPKLVDFMVRLKGAQAVLNFADILIGGRDDKSSTTGTSSVKPIIPIQPAPPADPPCDPPCEPPPQL